MLLTVKETALAGVLIIQPKRFEDSRGFFKESYHFSRYAELGITQEFVQDNFSHSESGVLRGLHYQLQHPQAKLVSVVLGEIFDVAVDIRRGSPTYGKWVGEYLSDENNRQMFVPEGFAHGFLVLSDSADVCYKCTDFYHPGDEYGVNWQDPYLKIGWPSQGKPVLSPKDEAHPFLAYMQEEMLPAYMPELSEMST